jgi:hypothetical protein
MELNMTDDEFYAEEARILAEFLTRLGAEITPENLATTKDFAAGIYNGAVSLERTRCVQIAAFGYVEKENFDDFVNAIDNAVLVDGGMVH